MAKKPTHLSNYRAVTAAYQALPSNSRLQAEYEEKQALFDAQTSLVQRFLQAQASQLADAIIRNQPQARFMLPDRVVVDLTARAQPVPVPSEFRDQQVGGVIDRITRGELRTTLHDRLIEMEGSENPAISTGTALIRHTIAMHMVHTLLPSGRTVSYRAEDGEETPTIPEMTDDEPASAITAQTDAIAEESQSDNDRGELLVPYVPAARRFYLPQWVAFDDEGRLLANSVNEAEAQLASMQRFVSILHFAVSLAPYFVFDPEYQRKRYGMLGQLINQGRALAVYQVGEMIRTIKQRAASNDLNRGLSLSVPYFDDQNLDMRTHDFVVIPAGRIMFVPAFVVQAGREEQVKVAQDTRLSPSTRKHLLKELNQFEVAFIKPGKKY